jgi:hypothetical protein
MHRDYAGASLPQQDYERLRSACRFDHAFPQTYEDWLALVADGNDLAARTGYPVDRVDVDVDEFERWCAGTAVRPCLPALRAFLIVKRYGLPREVQSRSSPSGLT